MAAKVFGCNERRRGGRGGAAAAGHGVADWRFIVCRERHMEGASLVSWFLQSESIFAICSLEYFKTHVTPFVSSLFPLLMDKVI